MRRDIEWREMRRIVIKKQHKAAAQRKRIEIERVDSQQPIAQKRTHAARVGGEDIEIQMCHHEPGEHIEHNDSHNADFERKQRRMRDEHAKGEDEAQESH